MSAVEQVPAHQWEEWLAENRGALLDIREPHEWQLGVLPGAQTISMRELVDRIEEVPSDQPLLCICRSGGRSQQVASYLVAQGYEASNMAGGMKALGMQD